MIVVIDVSVMIPIFCQNSLVSPAFLTTITIQLQDKQSLLQICFTLNPGLITDITRPVCHHHNVWYKKVC